MILPSGLKRERERESLSCPYTAFSEVALKFSERALSVSAVHSDASPSPAAASLQAIIRS